MGAFGGSLGTFVAASVLVVVLSGCLGQDATPTKSAVPAKSAPAMNVTAMQAVDYAGNTGTKAGPSGLPMGGSGCGQTGGPGGGGGMLPGGATNNPFTVTISNGTPQELHLKVAWASSGPAANSQYEVVASALGKATTGGGGGRGGTPARELARKTGVSPLPVDVTQLNWNQTEGRIQIRINIPAKSPAPVCADQGTAFTVKGAVTSMLPTPTAAVKAPAMSASASPKPTNKTQPR